MAEFGCPIAVVGGIPVVTAPAEIDVGNADMLRAAALRATARGHATLVVDLSKTHFCDSAGLSVLIRARKRAVAEGGELRLVASTPAVLGVFAITGLDRLIRVFPSLEAAVAELPAVAIEPMHGARTRSLAGLLGEDASLAG